MREESRILIDGNVPIPKVVAATTAGAITIVLVWVAGMLGVDLPEVVASAVTVLLMSVTAYVKR